MRCCTGFQRLLEGPGFFFLKIPGPGKSWKHFGSGKSWKLNVNVLESLGKISLKVVHFSSGTNGPYVNKFI